MFFCAFLWPIFLPLLLFATAAGAAPAELTFIDARRVYVSPAAAPIDDARIIIRKGKIAAVGPRSQVLTPKEAKPLGCSGGVVTAGFQNSHVHFTEEKFAGAAGQPAAQLARNVEAMLTRHGFTTVVDTASRVDNTVALRMRIERGDLAGPRILTAGGALYPPNGIPIYLRDLPPEFLAQLSQPHTPEQAAELVRANLDRGADVTKLFVATPQAGGRVTYMPRELARAAADETHRRQRLVLAHPTDIEGMRIAIDSGVNVLVHTLLGEAKTVWDQELIRALLAHDIAVIPTLKLWGYEMAKRKIGQGIIELATGDAVEQLRDFSIAGGQVLFGTDVGYMTDYDPTEEYRLMARALSPMEILASLTSAPAARWKEDGRRGRVAVGLEADLVILDGDPGVEPRNFARVQCTIRAGRVIYVPRGQSAPDA